MYDDVLSFYLLELESGEEVRLYTKEHEEFFSQLSDGKWFNTGFGYLV